jgi:hypothetical protein
LKLKSHILIADRTAEVLEDLMGISIHRGWLHYGAVLPDIHPFRRVQLHTPSIVAHHYVKEFQRLLTRNFLVNRRYRISMIIGLLTHYIADSCTLSHNIFNKDLRKHVRYEQLLDDLKYEIPYAYNVIMDEVKEHIGELKDIRFTGSEAFTDPKDFERTFLQYMEEHIEQINGIYMETASIENWHENIQHDMDQAVVNASVMITKFIMELQSVKPLKVAIL